MDRQAAQAEYEQALARARTLGLRVVADGYAEDGTRLWLIPSASDPAADWHRCWRTSDGFHCSCAAGQHHKPCVHKALARERYIAEEAALRKAETRQREPQPARTAGKGYTVPYEPRKGRQTHCAGCLTAFTAGEPITLLDRTAFHVGCAPKEPAPGPGADAPRRGPSKFDLMK